MISSMTEAIRKENGLTVFEIGNGVDSNLPIEQFINKLKMIVDAQENQYHDAISDTGDFGFSNKYKNLTIGADVLCMMQQKANFIGNLFVKKTSYLQASR